MNEYVKRCYRSLHLAAHKAEQPFHMSYFIAVYWTAHGSYGIIALGCAIVTLLSWENRS